MHIPARNHALIRTTFPTSHGFVPLPSHPSSSHFTHIRNPLPVSRSADNNALQTLFSFVATADNTPYYCVPAALNFRNNICGGEEDIYRYIRDVAQRGADLLAMVLGTEVMDDLDPGEGLKAMGSVEGHVVSRQGEGSSRWVGGLRDCAMANVLLPLTIIGGNTTHGGSLGLGPGGAGNAGGLSPFAGMRRSPSPSKRSPASQGLGVNGGLRPEMGSRSPSLFTPGHSYSRSNPHPARSPSLPLPRSHSPHHVNLESSSRPSFIQRRQHSPNSPFAYPERKNSSGLLNITIDAADVPTHIAWIERMLVEEFNTFVAVFEYKDRMWVRISGQIYLELKDFEWLGGVLRSLCERVGWGESLKADYDASPGEIDPRDRRSSEQHIASERVGRGFEKLNLGLETNFTVSQAGLESASTASVSTATSATGLRRFDVRVGKWVDG